MNPFLYYVWRKNSYICIEADFCDILVEEFSEWYEELLPRLRQSADG